MFVYNGFGRFGDQTPLQLLAGQSLGIGSVVTTPARGPDRLLRGDLGRDTGWLLPAAIVIAAGGIASRRRGLAAIRSGRASSCGAAGSRRWP